MDFYLIKGIKDLNIYEKYMVKDNRCKDCKEFWSKCCRPSMPAEENPLVKKKTSACGSLLNNIPQIIFFVVLALGGSIYGTKQAILSMSMTSLFNASFVLGTQSLRLHPLECIGCI